jgi:hypothetical protein
MEVPGPVAVVVATGEVELLAVMVALVQTG